MYTINNIYVNISDHCSHANELSEKFAINTISMNEGVSYLSDKMIEGYLRQSSI